MTDLEASIKEVTVYADRALITRVGSIQLAAGMHELRVLDLPTFVRDSLRASGHGPQGTRILDVDITTTYHQRSPEAEVQALQDACDLLRQRIALLYVRQEALNDHRQWLRSLGGHTRDFARGLASGQMNAQDCTALLTLAVQQAQQDAEAGLDLDEQVKQLQSELAAKERELVRKQGSQLPDRLTAVVTIEMLEDGAFTLALSYLVTEVSWRPLYDVRVSTNDDGNQGEVELTYNALVQQSTGEDWKQVNLALSTARPSQAALLPELYPRYLHVSPLPLSSPVGFIEDADQSKLSMSGLLSDRRQDDGIDTKRETEREILREKQAEVATATTEQSGAVCVFKIMRAVDIPSDNTPHKTTIAHDNLPCVFDYVSAPAVDPVVHLRATITNTTQNVLLPGGSSIFLRGEYVGTTQVQMTAPREQFKLFLGIDDTIKVKYEQMERAVEKGALLQGSIRRITYTYRITLNNYAPFARQVVLRDQFPVSQHERIKVKALAIQPPPSERTKQELLSWHFSLASDGEYQLEYRYAVEHPQDMAVSGLS